ncbi:hypothetical protein [Nocardioides sp. R-C-SC26]|uniref:hypothetical protein n=1 Tax=Nocardioides sp. R-C-SC26 TaxID=2870414 RepID=UPI001E55564B|nr:hypothetical protein [Nocardioides sp. R-C-SC26]
MEVVPTSVGFAARHWDEQNLDVAAAARQIGESTSHGFTDAVAPVVDRFARLWREHGDRLARRCEEQADGLRAALADYVATDAASALGFQRLISDPGLLLSRGLVEEVR